jgi:hypothetical protein
MEDYLLRECRNGKLVVEEAELDQFVDGFVGIGRRDSRWRRYPAASVRLVPGGNGVVGVRFSW